jgi:ELWxxDGT repeat protein
VNHTVFFAANDGVHGSELWKTNGTSAGTVVVKDVAPGGYGSYPAYLTNVNGTLFFTAPDGPHGTVLWKSNGTAAGTLVVADISPAFSLLGHRNLTNVNGTLFLSANDGVHGQELWKSNGTPALPTMACTVTSSGKATARLPAQSWSRTLIQEAGTRILWR